MVLACTFHCCPCWNRPDLHLLPGFLPGVAETDVEAARIEAHVGAHVPRQQDVAYLVVDRASHSTHFSWTRRHLRPSLAATAATCLGWLDWTPPIETSVSAPLERTSGMRYSSLRVLLPPKASPELASALGPDGRSPEMLGESIKLMNWARPNVNGHRGKSCSFS